MTTRPAPYLDDGDVVLHLGDCVEVMAAMEAESVDAVVCDPPYGLEFMGKEWDRLWNEGGDAFSDDKAWARRPAAYRPAYKQNRKCRGCGRWDRDKNPCRCEQPDWEAPQTPSGANQRRFSLAMQEWHQTWATEALRVLRPGGHLLAFGGPRTEHRLVCAIEDAGFEIRDKIAWWFGSGFPKSRNVSRDLADLLPAHERCACAPHSTGTPGGCEDGCPGCPRCGGGLPQSGAGDGHAPAPPRADALARSHAGQLVGGTDAGLASNAPGGDNGHLAIASSPGPISHPPGDSRSGGSTPSGTASSTSLAEQPAPHRTEPRTPDTSSSGGDSAAVSWRGHSHIAECIRCGGWQVTEGFGTALKPAYEGIVVARKPLAGTVAANVLAYGTGALNVDGCRVGTHDYTEAEWRAKGEARTPGVYDQRASCMRAEATPLPAGRWPANVVLDEEAAARLDAEVGERPTQATRNTPGRNGAGGMFGLTADGKRTSPGAGDTGGPSRFFYTAKATRAERDGASHPTVKPLALMRWLVRLVTPPGGVVIDPFAGSGTTLLAAREEGFRAIGIEQSEEYAAMAAHRLRQLSLLGGVA